MYELIDVVHHYWNYYSDICCFGEELISMKFAEMIGQVNYSCYCSDQNPLWFPEDTCWHSVRIVYICNIGLHWMQTQRRLKHSFGSLVIASVVDEVLFDIQKLNVKWSWDETYTSFVDQN